jgi:Cu2+-containing amine oxidase
MAITGSAQLASVRELDSRRHPLDPLSEEEISSACEILRREKQLGASHRFAIVHLVEPSKAELKSNAEIYRRAFFVVLDRD